MRIATYTLVARKKAMHLPFRFGAAPEDASRDETAGRLMETADSIASCRTQQLRNLPAVLEPAATCSVLRP